MRDWTPNDLAERLHERRCAERRKYGFHGPLDHCENVIDWEGGMDCHPPRTCYSVERCEKFIKWLVPWESLPREQRASRLADAAEVLAVLAEEKPNE